MSPHVITAPSTRRIELHFTCDWSKAHAARCLMRGTYPPDTFASVTAWVQQCYNPPSWMERTLLALNQLFDMHGVEPIRGSEWGSRYYGDVCASYLNTGDSYDATIIRCHRSDRWLLTSWGDYCERNMRRYGLGGVA